MTDVDFCCATFLRDFCYTSVMGCCWLVQQVVQPNLNSNISATSCRKCWVLIGQLLLSRHMVVWGILSLLYVWSMAPLYLTSHKEPASANIDVTNLTGFNDNLQCLLTDDSLGDHPKAHLFTAHKSRRIVTFWLFAPYKHTYLLMAPGHKTRWYIDYCKSKLLNIESDWLRFYIPLDTK